MLQFMEQGSIYNAINFNFCGGHDDGQWINSTGWTAVINTFICPSDSNAARGAIPAGTGPPYTVNYRGSVGTTSSSWYWVPGPGYASCRPDPFRLNNPPGDPGCSSASTGVFTYWGTYGLRDIARRIVQHRRLRRVAGRRSELAGRQHPSQQLRHRRHCRPAGRRG